MIIPQNLSFEGQISAALNDACGYDLDEFILNHIYKPRSGEVYALPGGDLPARHIFVGVVPRYRSKFDMKESDLAQITRKMMELGRCMLLNSLAFPAIGSGKGMFPKAKAARLIIQGVSERMEETIEDVRLVCHSTETEKVFEQKLRVIGWG